MITRIVVNDEEGVNLFDGSLKQFCDCFFHVSKALALSEIEKWIQDNHYKCNIHFSNAEAEHYSFVRDQIFPYNKQDGGLYRPFVLITNGTPRLTGDKHGKITML